MRGLGFALVAALCVGCGPPPISLDPSPREFYEGSYDDVYDAWTRSEEAFKWTDLADILYVTATFESWEFRWAYVIRYAYDFSIEPPVRNEMLQANLSSSRQEHRFFVTMAGFDWRESNITSKQSAWRVLLVAPDGHQTVPISMERIRRPTALERVYFPSISSYRHAFRLSFPAVDAEGRRSIPDGADHIVLRFTGARGRVDLRWDFQNPPQGG